MLAPHPCLLLTSCSQLLAPNPNSINNEDTTDALQEQGISAITRVGAQPQATTNPSTPADPEDSPTAERDSANIDDDDDRAEERKEDAGSDVHSLLYTDLDKLACASNNNNNNNKHQLPDIW